jgi:hypothetical protein
MNVLRALLFFLRTEYAGHKLCEKPAASAPLPESVVDARGTCGPTGASYGVRYNKERKNWQRLLRSVPVCSAGSKELALGKLGAVIAIQTLTKPMGC